MKVTVDSKDLNRLINFLPPFKDLFNEDRAAAIRVIGALSNAELSVQHELHFNTFDNKLRAIRYIRALFGLSLKDAKDIVDISYSSRVNCGTITGSLDRAKALAGEYGVSVTFKPVSL